MDDAELHNRSVFAHHHVVDDHMVNPALDGIRKITFLTDQL
jgi:hypothetical protein